MQLAEMISIMSGFGIETKDTSWVNIQQVIELLQKQAARIAELERLLASVREDRDALEQELLAVDFPEKRNAV